MQKFITENISAKNKVVVHNSMFFSYHIWAMSCEKKMFITLFIHYLTVKNHWERKWDESINIFFQINFYKFIENYWRFELGVPGSTE